MTANIGPVHEIYFFDHDGVRRLLLEGWEYLEYTQRVSSPWNSIIRIELPSEEDESGLLTFFRETLEVDWITEMYRTNEFDNERELVYEGMHRTLVDQVKQDGSVVFTLYGVGYTDLLKRRITLPPAGSETSNKSGFAETVAKDFIDEQAINPVDIDRIFPGLTNEADQARGNTAEYSARYTNLFTVISRVCEQGALDFGIVGSGTVGSFIFKALPLWGTDRRVGNADGNNPTTFDVYLNNMEIPILSKSAGDEVNYVYIGGQQQGANRIIQTLQNAARVALSPWNRREAFVDARQESTTDGLTTAGQAYLNENGAQTKFTFNINQTPGTQWLRDWELGDIVTALYFGQNFTKKIIQVSVVVSAGETGAAQIEVINAELEEIE